VQDKREDLDKMNSSALKSRDHGLEITRLVISNNTIYSKFFNPHTHTRMHAHCIDSELI